MKGGFYNIVLLIHCFMTTMAFSDTNRSAATGQIVSQFYPFAFADSRNFTGVRTSISASIG